MTFEQQGAALKIAFANAPKHDHAWEVAKWTLGIDDVRNLRSFEFNDLIALAECIRRGEVNVEKLL